MQSQRLQATDGEVEGSDGRMRYKVLLLILALLLISGCVDASYLNCKQKGKSVASLIESFILKIKK